MLKCPKKTGKLERTGLFYQKRNNRTEETSTHSLTKSENHVSVEISKEDKNTDSESCIVDVKYRISEYSHAYLLEILLIKYELASDPKSPPRGTQKVNNP